MEGNIKPKTPIIGNKNKVYEKTLMANPELILPLMLMSGLLGDIPKENEETVPEIVIPKSKFTANEILILPALLMAGLAQYVIPKTKLMDIKMVFGPTLFMAGIIGNSIIKPIDNIEPIQENNLVEKLQKSSRKYKKTNASEGNKKLIYNNFVNRVGKFVSRVTDFLSKYHKNSLKRINWKKRNLEQEEFSNTEKNVKNKNLIKKSQETESPIKKSLQKFFGSKGSTSSTIAAATALTATVAANQASATGAPTEIFGGVVSGTQLRITARENVDVPAWVPFPNGTTGLEFSSGYGYRSSSGRDHKGIDIAGDPGKPIITPITGVVTYARFNSGGYGNLVEITKGSNLVMLFAHLQRIDVREGSQVQAGTQIGTLGNTGRSTGPHLHWEIKLNGQYVSPSQWTKQNTPEISSSFPTTAQTSALSETFSSKGLVIFAGHNDVISGETGTNGPPGSPTLSRGETNEQYMNRMIAIALQNAGVGKYISSIKTSEGGDPQSNWSRAKKYVQQGYSAIEIHYDAATGGRSGLIFPTTRPLSAAEKSLARDFGSFPLGYRDLGAPKRGMSMLEVGPLTAERIRNSRSSIQSDVQRIIRSIRSTRTQADGGLTKLAKILVGEAGPEFVIPMSKMKNFMKLVTLEKIKTLQNTYGRTNNFTQVNLNKFNSLEQSANYKNELMYNMFDNLEENVTYYYQPTVYYT